MQHHLLTLNEQQQKQRILIDVFVRGAHLSIRFILSNVVGFGVGLRIGFVHTIIMR